MESASEDLPAGFSVAFEVTAAGRDGEHRLSHRGMFGELPLAGRDEDLDLRFGQDLGRGLVARFSRRVSHEQESPRDRHEDRQCNEERLQRVELARLERTALLESLEVLLNGPTRAVGVYHPQDVLGDVDGLGCVQGLGDRSLTFGDVDFVDPHDVDRERFGETWRQR